MFIERNSNSKYCAYLETLNIQQKAQYKIKLF